MTYVITRGCCNDGSCITVCPVQCIRPRPGDPDFSTTEQLYIDPATCIDCGACLDECPVDAVQADWDMAEDMTPFLDINAEYFTRNPLVGTAAPSFTRRVLPAHRTALRVAVVGSGPAACYAAGALSDIAGVAVTMIERLPTPFGLVRAGVAPDHQTTKKITDRFASVLARPNVQCYFNVEVGTDVTIAQLLEHHHAVLWAGGAASDRRLDIPGEDLPGCHSARSFVAWYNGHPDAAAQTFDLSGERAVVIGNGNVALDVARVLLRSADVLGATDIADGALAALSASNVAEVIVAARRGPEYSAYSLGELMALDEVEELTVTANRDEVPEHHGSDRRHEIIEQAAGRAANGATVHFRYGLEPVSIDGDGRAESVTFRTAGGELETIPATLVLRAIGYQATPVDGLPFDPMTATLPHDAGRVVDPQTRLEVTGVYCSGWVKRGPRGVIGTNKHDAEETVDTLLHDFGADRLPDPSGTADDFDALLRTSKPDLVDKQGWNRIDLEEKRRGREAARPRQKLITIDELLAASRTDA